MKIYYNTTQGQERHIDVVISDSSYRYREIMGDNNVVLSFSLTEFVEFPIGSWIFYDNEKYTTFDIPNFTKVSERQYDYTLTFEGSTKILTRYKFRNPQDGRLNFTLTAQPFEMLQHIVDNMNMDGRDSGWSVGFCVESVEKTQSFSHNSVLDALNSIAQLFDTEWEIIGKKINLRKVEYNKTNSTLALSYGKGNGFVSGVSQQKGENSAVDVLWVEGGERNINQQKYKYVKMINGTTQDYLHSSKIRLPQNFVFWYVPDSINEQGKGFLYIDYTETQNRINERYSGKQHGLLNSFINSRYNAYKATGKILDATEDVKTNPLAMQVYVDEDGFGIMRENRINNGFEKSTELTEIYPKRVLEITKVTNSDREKHFWEISAASNDVDYSDKELKTAENPTIIFEDGMLTGKEFEYSNYDNKTKEFKIVPQVIDEITMPDENSGFYPKVGEKFAVFHIALPDAYLRTAELELMLEGCKYLYERSEIEVEFNGTMDGIWSKKNWDNISPFLKLGGYVKFTDTAFYKDGKLLRILNIKDYITNPHAPEITLSNSTVSGSVSSELKKIPQNQVYASHELEERQKYNTRSFSNILETLNMFSEDFAKSISSVNQYFQNSISPITLQTMYLALGSERTEVEFGFSSAIVNNIVKDWQKVTYTPTWNKEKGCLEVPNFVNGAPINFRHLIYTNKQGEITTDTAEKFPYWRIESQNTELKPDAAFAEKPFYLYLKCRKPQANEYGKLITPAEFILSENVENDTADFYLFPIGFLNSERDGERSFVSIYGHTEISGNHINTGRIVSNDGSTVIDLENNIIQGRFNFKDGLISDKIWVGKNESSAKAGFGGKNKYGYESLIWAGKNNDGNYVFNILSNGEMVYYANNGQQVFKVFPRQSEYSTTNGYADVSIRGAQIQKIVGNTYFNGTPEFGADLKIGGKKLGDRLKAIADVVPYSGYFTKWNGKLQLELLSKGKTVSGIITSAVIKNGKINSTKGIYQVILPTRIYSGVVLATVGSLNINEQYYVNARLVQETYYGADKSMITFQIADDSSLNDIGEGDNVYFAIFDFSRFANITNGL